MDKKLDQILSLIRRFRPAELPEVLNSAFGSNAWSDIKLFASHRKLNLSNCRNVAMVCLNIYKAQKPTAADIQKVLWYLTFFDVTCHSTITWKCALLLNKEDNFPTDLESLQRKIQQAYRCEARDVEMIVTLKEDLIWLMVIEKKITKKGIKYGKPFFVVININLEKQYVFSYPLMDTSSNNVDHLMLVSKALGYEEYKKVNFEGKDVRSLFEMIKRHKTEQNQIVVFQPTQQLLPLSHQSKHVGLKNHVRSLFEMIKRHHTEQNQIVVFQPRKFLVEENVLDFTAGKDRLKYASDVLPPGLTNLSEFTVHSRDQWRGDIPLSRSCLVTTQIRIRAKGRSSSVETVLRELIFLGIVTIPVPHYISRLPYLNRNVVQLSSENVNANQTLNCEDKTF